MAIALSNVTDNLSEGIHNIKGKYRQDNKKWEKCKIKNNY